MGLQVLDLTKKYGEKMAVDHLSFEMKEPGVYALLGTNGAGKTTTIRMMLNMLAKDGGRVMWNGQPLDVSVCSVGYLAEERGLYPKYTLMDQLLYFAALRGIPAPEAKERIRYWARRLEVEEYLYPGESTQEESDGGKKKRLGAGKKSGGRAKAKPRLADQLSKGNQQKIQFMTALLPDPELLILDEPLSGLDPVNADLFKSVIREEIGKGKYLIMSSHQMATVEEFCTDLTILHRSRAVLQGNLNEIKKSCGRVNLHLKTEQEVRPLIENLGITLLSEKEREYHLRVTGEEQANELLVALIQSRVTVIVFELREPSLHEIFVSHVGEE